MTFSIYQNGSIEWNKIHIFQVGVEDNLRTNNIPGIYNFAVEILISKRFELEFKLKDQKIFFPDIELEIGLQEFCEVGGFDESESLHFIDEFIMRKSNFQVHVDEKFVNRLQESSFKHKLSIIKNKRYKQFKADDEQFIEKPLFSEPDFNHNLTIGLTVSDEYLFDRFLNSFCESFSQVTSNFSFLICCFNIDSQRIFSLFQKYGIDTSRCKVLEEAWGFEQAKLGNLGEWFLSPNNCSGVSFGRCVLHRALFDFFENEMIWILDDDIVFSKSNLSQLNESILDMQRRNLVVGIGTIIGDAPIPAPYIIRTQAVDFYYASFSNFEPKWGGMEHISNNHEIHHDLSTKRSDHLEVPLGIKRAFNSSVHDWSIFSGKSLTRTIHNEWENLEAVPTRGGNTLLLSKAPLIFWPNVAPKCGEIQFRRGDTLWAKLIEKERPDLIGSVKLTLNQVRLNLAKTFTSVDNLRGDILGSMFTRSIGNDKINASWVIGKSKLREARLIMNLFRTYRILDIMNYNSKHLMELKRLIWETVETRYPLHLSEDLEKFIGSFHIKINNFRVLGERGTQ